MLTLPAPLGAEVGFLRFEGNLEEVVAAYNERVPRVPVVPTASGYKGQIVVPPTTVEFQRQEKSSVLIICSFFPQHIREIAQYLTTHANVQPREFTDV